MVHHIAGHSVSYATAESVKCRGGKYDEDDGNDGFEVHFAFLGF
jgi:hypothetical protein